MKSSRDHNLKKILLLVVATTALPLISNNAALLSTLTQTIKVPAKDAELLEDYAGKKSSALKKTIKKRSDRYPLYQVHPTLEKSFPSIQLCTLPTPAYKLKKASQRLGIDLYIKRDDLSNKRYGGNKNRALEFFIADAQRMNADAVMTIGSAGSTHAVATAQAADSSGYTMYAELTPHPNSRDVHDLLLLLHQYGALMHFYPSNEAREQGIIQTFLNHQEMYGSFPYFIPSGGSSALGIIGYVSAMFELKNQIQQGLLPKPDYIYVACGSKGTSAGLLLGAKATGLLTTIIPVCIKPDDKKTYVESICELSKKAYDLLRSADTTFPLCTITTSDIPIVHYCMEEGYGVFTAKSMEAKKFLYEAEGIVLDGTYTAKAFQGLLSDVKKGILKGKKVLFWHTYCSQAEIENTDYTVLPLPAQKYFEEPVQALDT